MEKRSSVRAGQGEGPGLSQKSARARDHRDHFAAFLSGGQSSVWRSGSKPFGSTFWRNSRSSPSLLAFREVEREVAGRI